MTLWQLKAERFCFILTGFMKAAARLRSLEKILDVGEKIMKKEWTVFPLPKDWTVMAAPYLPYAPAVRA